MMSPFHAPCTKPDHQGKKSKKGAPKKQKASKVIKQVPIH
jgi:hypothetical protein